MSSKLATLLLIYCLVDLMAADFFIIRPGFGDRAENKREFRERCIEKCRGTERAPVARCSFMHPNACNTYFRCMRFGLTWLIVGDVTERGSLFNERKGVSELAFEQFERKPLYDVCIGDSHPCLTQKPIPVNGMQCGGYQMCENGTMVEYRCPEETGFNAMTGKCDLECTVAKRRILRTTCGPSPKGENYFQFNETVVYGKSEVPVIEALETRCPAFTSYQTMGKCGCDAYKVTVKPCENQTVINLSSSDNSWDKAKKNDPVPGSGAITGEATVVDMADRPFGGSARFEGEDFFISNWMIQNDLGLHFDLLFTFLSRQDGRNGFPISREDNPPVNVALVDNSADDKDASYGCWLSVERTHQGRVVCHVSPSRGGGKQKDDVTVKSELLDLRRRISVQFAKDDREGRLLVRPEGGRQMVKTVRFSRGVRAFGNLSPLIIGAGKEKRPFKGYMDDMYIRKYCSYFLESTTEV